LIFLDVWKRENSLFLKGISTFSWS
jgi:hypothetical protein